MTTVLTTRRRRVAPRDDEKIVERLAGGIAHDFNNLLTAILGYTELLLNEHGRDDGERQDLEEIWKAGQRAASITRQLLAYSRQQVLLPTSVDVNEVVSGLQGLLARAVSEDVAIICEPAPESAVIRIDRAQLEQAVMTLVVNARDALPSGGQIRLEVAILHRSEADMPAEQPSPPGQYVRLRVVDNGVGIAADARPHLFEPFFTTKGIGKGSGMGLASAYGIVRQSQGFITVESEPGSGSAFAMHFPAVTPAIRSVGDLHPQGRPAAVRNPRRGR